MVKGNDKKTANLMMQAAEELNNASKRIEQLEALLTEMDSYLDDRHPQGSRSAIAVNTISTNSIFHCQIKEILGNLNQSEGAERSVARNQQ